MLRKVVSIKLSSADARETPEPAQILAQLNLDIHNAIRTRKKSFSAVVVDLKNVDLKLQGNFNLEKWLHEAIDNVLRARNRRITRSAYNLNNSSLIYYVS